MPWNAMVPFYEPVKIKPSDNMIASATSRSGGQGSRLGLSPGRHFNVFV